MQRRQGAFVLHLPFGARAENAVVSLARYLGKFFWPTDLIVCYAHPGYWPIAIVTAAAALVLAISWLAWRQRDSRPWVLVGWLWFLVVMLPVIGFVQVGFQAMADRYTYLPLVGIELALLGCLREVTRLHAKASGWLALAFLTAIAGVTWVQLGNWRDSVSLFEHAVAVNDRNDVAEDFLASAYFEAGRMEASEAHADRAHALNPRNDKPLITLAGIREQQGRIGEAVDFLRAALRLQPANPPVQAQLGTLELSRGHGAEARRLLIDALRSSAGLRDHMLEIAYRALQNHDAATSRLFCEVVLTVNPNDTDALVTFGQWLILSGNRSAGIVEWRRALELEPNYPGLRERLKEVEP